MFVDACAIVSIFADEDSAPAYDRALAGAEAPFTSALAAWEAIIVLSRPEQLNCSYLDAHAVVTEWLDLRNIALRDTMSPSDALRLAVEVAQKHGIGKRALSNFDCFHYAYAKVAGTPLLTLDGLLRQTDAETLPDTH
ncbi:type II toxin-antitoxin system VapC family toxin [Sandaracinobacter sp. RS1-74]|uniref:type II toxin-antitoxin system VapC family toxin n=1 Tax=Sandaracinobacteroides sayramensis TaxID=2913411 RepID=UPI001EDBB631|nr:type II toxin-antitoxin system VapC family toxin [Sandaracinobacteroides sayramensis]MCG2841245.1 type II toxin-antitoxin system VapC family toxin [Sandaracinobacteroides sayramensis]